MEAQVITLHGRQVCKLVDTEKVKFIKDKLSKHWEAELIKLQSLHRPEPLQLIK